MADPRGSRKGSRGPIVSTAHADAHLGIVVVSIVRRWWHGQHPRRVRPRAPPRLSPGWKRPDGQPGSGIIHGRTARAGAVFVRLDGRPTSVRGGGSRTSLATDTDPERESIELHGEPPHSRCQEFGALVGGRRLPSAVDRWTRGSNASSPGPSSIPAHPQGRVLRPAADGLRQSRRRDGGWSRPSASTPRRACLRPRSSRRHRAPRRARLRGPLSLSWSAAWAVRRAEAEHHGPGGAAARPSRVSPANPGSASSSAWSRWTCSRGGRAAAAWPWWSSVSPIRVRALHSELGRRSDNVAFNPAACGWPRRRPTSPQETASPHACVRAGSRSVTASEAISDTA